jgi:hypothetical protein
MDGLALFHPDSPYQTLAMANPKTLYQAVVQASK